MKYYWSICKIYTYYGYGTTYKYVLWEISESTFFTYAWMYKITSNEKGWILY